MTEEQKEEIEKEEPTLASQQDQAAEEPSEETTPEKTEEDPEQINWRKFREERERERRERAEEQQALERKRQEAAALKEVVDTLMSKQDHPMTQQQQEQMIADLIDEDIPTGRDIKQFVDSKLPDIINRILDSREKSAAEERQKKELESMPTKLRQAHTDFDKVVTQENLDYLDYHHPEIAKALSYMPNGFEKWSSVYSTVRKLVPSSGASDLRRMESNAMKPQAASAVASPPSAEMGYGRSLTEAERMENYKKLKALARGA